MGLSNRLSGVTKPLSVLALLGIERLRTGAVYAPFGHEYWADPYAMYRSLQRRDPCHRSLFSKAWVISRYDDVTSVLRDGRFLVDARKLMASEDNAAQPVDPDGLGPTLLTLDPPDHTRLRNLVSRAFSAHSIEALRPRVQATVDACLDAMAGAGRMDVVRDLAVPLPVTVIAEMLGVPLADGDRFKQWSDDTTRGIGYPSAGERARAGAAVRELKAYLTGMAEERRRNPGDDLLSALLQIEEEGVRLSTEEALSMSALLLNAGHAMTTNFIALALATLLQHPEQMQALRDNPSLMGEAVEELLRYDGPAQATGRFVLEDVRFGKQTIQAGQHVVVLLAGADRDPERFPEPDRLDFARRDNHHLAFGYGLHHCLGAPLARLEAQVVLATVLERFPDLRLATPTLAWDSHMFVRGLRSLPVAF